MPPNVTGLSGTISEIYRRHVWVTPSGMFGLPHFEFIHKVIGADRIIWSVDYPFLTLDGTQEFLGWPCVPASPAIQDWAPGHPLICTFHDPGRHF
jgi:Amidohydrolase